MRNLHENCLPSHRQDSNVITSVKLPVRSVPVSKDHVMVEFHVLEVWLLSFMAAGSLDKQLKKRDEGVWRWLRGKGHVPRE